MHLEPRVNPLQAAFTSIFNNLRATGTTEPQPKFPAAWEISGRKIEFGPQTEGKIPFISKT